MDMMKMLNAPCAAPESDSDNDVVEMEPLSAKEALRNLYHSPENDIEDSCSVWDRILSECDADIDTEPPCTSEEYDYDDASEMAGSFADGVPGMLQCIPGDLPVSLVPKLPEEALWQDCLLYDGGIPMEIGHGISVTDTDSSNFDDIVKRIRIDQVPSQGKVSPPNIAEGLGKRQEARDLVALEDFLLSQANWMLYDGCLCLYQGSYWVKLKDKDMAIREIRQLLFRHGDIRETLTASDYRRIYNGLLSNPRLEAPEDLNAPAYTINCLDGTLNLLTLESHVHRPEDYFFYCFNVSVGDVLYPPMSGSYFERYVYQISDNIPGVRRQLLEVLAIAMTGTQLKYFFAMLGPSNSGKSQFARFAQELLGHQNVETIHSIGDFGNRFTTSSLYGKLLVSCGDLPNGYLPPDAIGVLKQFCGSDAVKGEIKHGKSFTFYKTPLVLLAGNHPIKVRHADREDALLNRLVIIPFADPGISTAEKIENLYQCFVREAPYIVHEAAIVFQDLADRNWEPTRVHVPAEYAFQEGDSGLLGIQDFIENCIFSNPGTEVSTADLFQAYCDFTSEDGCHQMNATSFGRSFSSVIKQLMPEATPTKRVHGTDSRGYVNISLK